MIFTFSAIKAPCYNCPDRSISCKSKCFRWAYYEMEKDLERIEKEKTIKTIMDSNAIERNRSKRVRRAQLHEKR